MLIIRAHARRDGQLVDVAAEELVPGDVVVFEAGDKIPADGRLLVAATLEIEEAALTGESTPVLKAVEAVAGGEVPLRPCRHGLHELDRDTGSGRDGGHDNGDGDRGRSDLGDAEPVEQEKTPLTRQLDQLTVLLTIMAGAALAPRRRSRADPRGRLRRAFIIGISLAVAAIPTGLPAVVTTVLARNAGARGQGGIVKRLRSVETLGSTSAICSDKTGTLTLNQMTARQLVVAGRRYSIEGEGYSTNGKILRAAGETDTPLEPFLLPMALANDAAVRDGEIVGDPTEAALVVLAAKWDRCRRDAAPPSARGRGAVRLRLQADGDLPRDGGRGQEGRALLRQGAPDVLLARSSQIRTWTARLFPSRPAAIVSWPRTTASRAKACACWLWPPATSTRARSTPRHCSMRSRL